MPEPLIPRSGDPLKADWGERLIRWIKDEVMPRGDQCTTIVNGNTISVAGDMDSGGGGEYHGFFVLANASDKERQQIQITDATGQLTDGLCGVFVSGIDKIMVPVQTLAVNASGVVVMEAQYNKSSSEWTVSFKLEKEIPEFTADKFTAVLGYVNFKDKAITSIIQIWNNGVIYNNRYS